MFNGLLYDLGLAIGWSASTIHYLPAMAICPPPRRLEHQVKCDSAESVSGACQRMRLPTSERLGTDERPCVPTDARYGQNGATASRASNVGTWFSLSKVCWLGIANRSFSVAWGQTVDT